MNSEEDEYSFKKVKNDLEHYKKQERITIAILVILIAFLLMGGAMFFLGLAKGCEVMPEIYAQNEGWSKYWIAVERNNCIQAFWE